MQFQKTFQKTVGSIFCWIGGGLLLAAAIAAAFTLNFRRSAQSTVGQVVGYERVENAAPFLVSPPGEGTLYYPVVRFRAPNAEWVEFTARGGNYRQVHTINSSVPVLFPPADPERGIIDNFWGLWARTLIFAGIGGLFMLAGLLFPLGFRSGPQVRVPHHPVDSGPVDSKQDREQEDEQE